VCSLYDIWFFAPQSFAFDPTKYCEQEKARLNKKYENSAQKLENERNTKVRELISEGCCRCEVRSGNETQIVFFVPDPLVERVKEFNEDFEKRKEFLSILKEDEFKTANWVCQNK
jgi:arabinogalactan endo-1,4-beta-galactosidase